MIALNLPIICNINPRSLYNKVDEFCTFVESNYIDVVFISETWESELKPLKEIIKIENYEIVSNVHQRKGHGGRAAIIANGKNFDVKDLTNTTVQVPWGVEAVWALLTPKLT